MSRQAASAASSSAWTGRVPTTSREAVPVSDAALLRGFVEELVAAGAVRRNLPVKVLGNGDLSAAVQVSAHAFSDAAKNKIVAAGGSVTELA